MEENRWVTLLLALAFTVQIAVSTVSFVAHRLLWAADGGANAVSPLRWMAVTFAPVAVAGYGLRRRSLSATGAAAALLVGVLATLSHAGFFGALLTFFLTSSRATRFREERKRRFEGAAHRRGGQRDWLQVLCNGGAATQLALLYLLDVGCAADLPVDFRADYRASWLGSAVLGALACCCGDTWASEIGSVVGDRPPRLITTLRPVPAGTNGGVSLVGLLASAAGGASVGLGFFLGVIFTSSHTALSRSPSQLLLVAVGAAAGLLGSLIDSLLGATMQYSGADEGGAIVERPGSGVRHISGLPLLDNHGVNIISSIVTASITPSIAQALMT